MPRYPDIEPYETGLLDTGDGNLVYWEACGNPDGLPALIVHGGPGSGCTAGNRRSFDPEKFRIIFDQRNCGRSLPHASDPAADMSLNTTGHLLMDMEQLREHLGAWPSAELIIEDSGHTGSTTMTDEMHAAADRLYEAITNPA